MFLARSPITYRLHLPVAAVVSRAKMHLALLAAHAVHAFGPLETAAGAAAGGSIRSAVGSNTLDDLRRRL